MKKICVIGLGYIGLPTASLLACKGYNVHGVDVVEKVINTINKGEIHIVEPELADYVKKAVKNKNLKASLKPEYADVFIIAVPTPFKDNFKPNIDYVISATNSILPYIKEGNIIVLESTSPVGTTHKIESIIKDYGIDTSKIYIAHCPERVLPGKIMRELISNDRIVGGISQMATKKVAEFYREFVKGEVLETCAKTAEMTKLTENSFRDVNIAFANELSILCDQFGISAWELIELANRHPRVNILKPGCGVGGHCIAVDPWFIISEANGNAKLIKKAREINNYKAQWSMEKIKNCALEFELKNKKKPKIACMGLAFKPDVDDLRESPALYIAKNLKKEGFEILAVEPNIRNHPEFKIINFKDALVDADIIVFLVGHKEFLNLNLKNKIVLDFCGICNAFNNVRV